MKHKNIRKGLYLSEYSGGLFECTGRLIKEKAEGESDLVFVMNYRLPFFPLHEIYGNYTGLQGDCLLVEEFDYLVQMGAITYIGKV
jgi:hypothetical protein